MRATLLSLLALAPLSLAKIVTYNWCIDWVRAAPDGFERPVIGINNNGHVLRSTLT
jgi:iron transport multicopper oxidase